MFTLLSSRRLKPRTPVLQIRQTLTETVTLELDDELAVKVIPNCYHIGLSLFRIHKDMLCRFVRAAVLNKVPALQGIKQFYELHGVGEDDYQEESAWKAWQRWAKNRKKNGHFFGQKTDKPSTVLSKKMNTHAKKAQPLPPLTFSTCDMQIELAVSRFMSGYSEMYKRKPKKLEKHIRIYYYMEMQGLTAREVAAKLGTPFQTAAYARQAIRQKSARNPFLGGILEQERALPQEQA